MQEIVLKLDDKDSIASLDKLDAEIFPGAPWGKEDLLSNMNNSYDSVLTLEKPDGFICGYAILRVLGDAEILRIGVSADCRRMGYAGILMRKMLTIAKEKQSDRMLLEVRIGNKPAIGLYRSFGFKDIAWRKDYYSLPTEDALIMEAVIERID